MECDSNLEFLTWTALLLQGGHKCVKTLLGKCIGKSMIPVLNLFSFMALKGRRREEFLSAPGVRGDGLLNNIEFSGGFLTSFDQLGVCPRCQVHQELVR